MQGLSEKSLGCPTLDDFLASLMETIARRQGAHRKGKHEIVRETCKIYVTYDLVDVDVTL